MKKLLVILLAVALVFAFAACGNTKDPGNQPEEIVSEEPMAEEAAEQEVEFTTVSDGVLIMATNAAFPPYEFYENDQVVGIDAEIAALIADKLGLQLQIEDMEFGSIIAAVQSGKVDVGIAGMTVTEDRLQNVNFTDSYATGVQVVIVKEDSPITSVDDLGAGGYTIGVQQDTTGDIYTTGDFGEEADEQVATIDRYNKGADAVAALVAGKVDCVVIDSQPAEAFVAANEGLKILDTAYTTEDYAICISKDNEALLSAVNSVLNELIADGSVQSILEKYISAQ